MFEAALASRRFPGSGAEPAALSLGFFPVFPPFFPRYFLPALCGAAPAEPFPRDVTRDVRTPESRTANGRAFRAVTSEREGGCDVIDPSPGRGSRRGCGAAPLG